MADRFDEMAGHFNYEEGSILSDRQRATFAAALRAESKRAQEAMRERAAVVAGTLAETTYDNEPEFSAVTDVEVAIRNLPIEDTP